MYTVNDWYIPGVLTGCLEEYASLHLVDISPSQLVENNFKNANLHKNTNQVCMLAKRRHLAQIIMRHFFMVHADQFSYFFPSLIPSCLLVYK